MRAILLLMGLLSLNCNSQSLFFKPMDTVGSESFDQSIKVLNRKVLEIYKNDDKAKFYDDVFRLYILQGDYEKGLNYLNMLKGLPKYKDLDYKEILGIPFELYSLSKLNPEKISYERKYNSAFKSKLNSVPDKTKVYLNSFFINTESVLKNNTIQLLKKSVKNDSISLVEAIKLCRYYTSYIMAKESDKIVIPLIKNIEFQQFVLKDSVVLKTKSGNEVSLGFLRYKKEEGKLPTILNFSIYNRGRLNVADKLNSMKGYIIVKAYSRGVYLSKDKVSPFEFEIEDVNEVIDWITKQPWSNGKVGMIGGSYDGFSQWAATKSLHPALKTIIPAASVGFGVDFPMYNNCFSPYMFQWLSYVNKETNYDVFNDDKKWLSVFNSYYKNGTAFNKIDSIYGKPNLIFQKWLKHPSYDKFWQSKMPSKKDFSKINIPILTLTGYYDADQRGAMFYYNQHLKYNKNAEHYFIIGPYGHTGVVSGVQEEYKGYKIDSVAKIDLNDISYQWFDYILKGKNKPDFLKDRFNYQTMGSNTWKSTFSIKQASNKKLILFLNREKLEESKPNLDYTVQQIDFLNRKDTLKNFDGGKIFDNSILEDDLKDKLVFESETFDKSIEINGSFTGKLRVSINKKDMDISINLYEKLATGQYLKLSHEYFARASYAKNNAKRKLLKPNKVESIPITNTFFTSRKFEKGSKLIMVLGIRKSADAQINYGTGKDVSTETIADAKEPLEVKWYNDSYIEIPVLEK